MGGVTSAHFYLCMIYEAKFVIECFAETYRAGFDDLNEKEQEGERGQKLDEAASEFEEMVDFAKGRGLDRRELACRLNGYGRPDDFWPP